MPKIKTHKATAKRFKITGRGESCVGGNNGAATCDAENQSEFVALFLRICP